MEFQFLWISLAGLIMIAGCGFIKSRTKPLTPLLSEVYEIVYFGGGVVIAVGFILLVYNKSNNYTFDFKLIISIIVGLIIGYIARIITNILVTVYRDKYILGQRQPDGSMYETINNVLVEQRFLYKGNVYMRPLIAPNRTYGVCEHNENFKDILWKVNSRTEVQILSSKQVTFHLSQKCGGKKYLILPREE